VLEVDGRVVHADGAARDKLARAGLRQGALRIDHARRRGTRLSPDEVTEAWQALYLGRWSLLDSFDHDGRRYFVAWPNQPLGDGAEAIRARSALSNLVRAYRCNIGVTSPMSRRIALSSPARALRIRLGAESAPCVPPPSDMTANCNPDSGGHGSTVAGGCARQRVAGGGRTIWTCCTFRSPSKNAPDYFGSRRLVIHERVRELPTWR
jgi:hypothetical protein